MGGFIEKVKSEEHKHCCYGTCNRDTRYRQREDMQGVYFIPFPKPITRRELLTNWSRHVDVLKQISILGR